MRTSVVSVTVDDYDDVRARFVPAHTVDVPGLDRPIDVSAELELWVGALFLSIADQAKAREIATAILAALPTNEGASPETPAPRQETEGADA